MKVYLDYAATSPLDKRVFTAMKPYLTGIFANPSSVHFYGREALSALDNARDTVAAAAGVRALETYFCSGGSEADNWGLKGVARAVRERDGRNKILLSDIEHPAVFRSAQALQKEGFDVVFVPVDKRGIVDTAFLEEHAAGSSIVCVMAANNETGVVQPVEKIGKIAHENGAYFMCDAVQAAGVLPLHTITSAADIVAVSAHKFYGPKGVGALFCKKGVPLSPLVDGGAQERGLRGGTSDAAGAVGLAEALRLAGAEREETVKKIRALRDGFEREVLSQIPFVTVNGDRENRLPGHSNLCFAGVDGSVLLRLLDGKGIAVSAGSACAAGDIAPSRVLLAMGKSETEAKSSLRFSFGKGNDERQRDYVLQTLVTLTKKLRR